MPRKVQVALARVYRSTSSYGDEPFTAPTGSPKIVSVGGEVLEVHFGRAPEWLHYAETRIRIAGGAMLRGTFRKDPIARDTLDARLASATKAPLVDARHRWLVAFILRSEVEWLDEEVVDAPWLWWNWDRLFTTTKDVAQRVPSLDLAVRALKHFVPNVLDEIVVKDRVYVARDASFADAFGIPDFTMGDAEASVKGGIDRIESILSTAEVDSVLANAIAAPAVPRDSTRPDRFKSAIRDDLFVDDGGSLGRYELLREMQPVLMRASAEKPLAVMFIDMNGLKQINDELGHHHGDAAIAEFRAAVQTAHSGHLFRTGGDEFVMFALGAPDDTVEIATTILQEVASRAVEGRHLSASVGIVLADDPLEDPRAIIKRADQEMYRAKAISKLPPPRICTLAVVGRDVVIVSLRADAEPATYKLDEDLT